MAYQAFYNLDAWKHARKLKLSVYEILKRFPKDEKFELHSQLRKAVRSISTNISEGHGRFTFKDQCNFCVIARGSHSETLNHLIDAFDSGYITSDELVALKKIWEETGRLLNDYLSFLQSRKNDGNQKAGVAEDEGIYQSPCEIEMDDFFLEHLELSNSPVGKSLYDQSTNQPIN